MKGGGGGREQFLFPRTAAAEHNCSE
jgi:hypothetical protein